MLDTLQISERLQESGFDERQSKALTVVLRDAVHEQIASKQDLELGRIESWTVATDRRIDAADHKIEMLKRDLTIRMGAMQIALPGVLPVLMKLL